MESTTRLTDPLTMLPAEYWEAEGPMYGALADNVSVDGLLFFSVRDLPIGSRLNVRIFYANEYELDDIKATSETVQKHVHFADNWKGYKYALKFLEVSEEDLRKLTYLLNSNSMIEKISRMESIPLESTSPDKTKSSSSPSADPDSPAGPTAKCEFYKSGKCLKTHAFCDLCQNEDGLDLVQERGTKNRRPSFFTAILSKLADNFRSASQKH